MNHRKLPYLLLLVALTAVLAACGGATVSPATAAPPAISSAASEGATAAPTATSPSVSEAATAAPTAASSSASEAATAAPTATPPSVSEVEPTATSGESSSDTQEVAAPISSESTKLNLNQVTSDELLATIPGFSNRMVREFLEYRPYVSIRQFRQEIGKYVDDAQVAEWEQYVYVPVAVDASDAETLKQLPGVDDTIAQALIDGRPYGSNEAFLARLASQAGDAQAAAAAAYLAAN